MNFGTRAFVIAPIILFLFFSPYLIQNVEVSAQINNPSRTERTNIDKALENLNELNSTLYSWIESKTLRDSAKNRQMLQKFNSTLSNLESKVSGGEIKSVPDLDDKDLKKYRHGMREKDRGSPIGAYCDGDTWVRDGNRWVKCREGDIILDSTVLDPNNGTPIDPSTQDGWEKKVRLAHILFHEKMHEVMLADQLLRLESTPAWKFKTDAQKALLREQATKKASSPEAHGEVYNWQKAIVKMYKKMLEIELKELKRNRRANSEQIEDVTKKIDWIKKELKDLESKKKSAIRGHGFGFQECGWPDDILNEVVGIYVTYPGGYWLLGVELQDGEGIRYSLSDEVFLDELTEEEEMPGPPTIYLIMEEGVFSGLQVQPEVCDYISWAIETEQIVVTRDNTQLRDLIPQPLEIIAIDGLTNEPLVDTAIRIYTADGVLVQEVIPGETGKFATVLENQEYYVSVEMRIFGQDVTLTTTEPFDPRFTNQIQITVSAFLFPVRFLPLVATGSVSLIAGWSSGWLFGKVARGRFHRAIPWIVGAFVGSAILIGSGQVSSLLGLF